jgi:hydroxymethylpyrimidine pyrophosphatase-like HAD family hydrolase
MKHAGFFSDLDNTLIFSARHLQPNGPEVVGVEIYPDRVGGYMTRVAHGLLAEISYEIPFIPVTARHNLQYNRLRLEHCRIEHAVLGNGAFMLLRGERQADWDAHIRTLAQRTDTASLTQLRARIEPELHARHLAFELDVIEDIFCVYIMDAQPVPADMMPELVELGAQLGYRLSLQHRKLHIVPMWLSKGAAMLALAERLNLDTLYAAGDAVLDASLVDNATHGWVPRGAEIEAAYADSEHVSLTEDIGVLAGEQILRGVAGELRLRTF